MVEEALFEQVPGTADVSPWLGIGSGVSVGVGVVTTTFGDGAAGGDVIDGGNCVVATTAIVSKGDVVVMATTIHGGIIIDAVDFIGDVSAIIYARDTAVAVIDVIVIAGNACYWNC